MWYYNVNGVKYGPIEYEQLKQLIQKRIVTPQTLIFTEIMRDFRPAGEIPGIKEIFRKKPCGKKMPSGPISIWNCRLENGELFTAFFQSVRNGDILSVLFGLPLIAIYIAILVFIPGLGRIFSKKYISGFGFLIFYIFIMSSCEGFFLVIGMFFIVINILDLIGLCSRRSAERRAMNEAED